MNLTFMNRYIFSLFVYLLFWVSDAPGAVEMGVVELVVLVVCIAVYLFLYFYTFLTRKCVSEHWDICPEVPVAQSCVCRVTLRPGTSFKTHTSQYTSA